MIRLTGDFLGIVSITIFRMYNVPDTSQNVTILSSVFYKGVKRGLLF